MELLKNKKGITLVALIITIIVLLILATVSILLAINSGIIKKTSDATERYSSEEEKEKSFFERLFGNSDDSSDDNNEEILYSADRLDFDGTNYVNTGIKLFSQENINKDFEIYFEIVSCINGGAYMACNNNNNDSKSGLSLYTTSGLFATQIYLNSSGYWYTYSKKGISEDNPFKVRIRRIHNTIFLTVWDQEEKSVLDWSGSNVTFDTPLSFGASISNDGTPFEFSIVQFKNIQVKYINVNNYTETKRADYYKLDGTIKFDGTKYIDTGVQLFSQANKDKDFEISFKIKMNEKWDNNKTVLECVDSTKNSLTGMNMIGNSNAQNIINLNTKSETYGKNYVDFKIYRKYGSIFCIANNTVSKVLGKIETNFDSSLIFGASLDSSGNTSNYYTGVISDIEVKVTEPVNKTSYTLAGPVEFTGSNYIDTEVCLFSSENVNKDFEVSFDIINRNTSNSNQATLMSSMNEACSPWPGFVYRINTSQNKYEIRGGANGNSSRYAPYAEENTTQNVKITRENKIIYYSIDGGEKVQIGNFTNVTPFNYPVTFGAGLNENMGLRRFFNGTLANLKVELKN